MIRLSGRLARRWRFLILVILVVPACRARREPNVARDRLPPGSSAVLSSHEDDYVKVSTPQGQGYLGGDWTLVGVGRRVTVLDDEGPEHDYDRLVRFRVEEGAARGLIARTRRVNLRPKPTTP